MSTKKQLLEVRKKLKSKKPVFMAQDSHKRKEINTRWRRPRGLHSKMRLIRKGYRAVVSKGWRSPALVRGFHKSGLEIVYVSTPSELSKINAKSCAVVVKSSVGGKKTILIYEEAKKLGLVVVNVKDADTYVSALKNAHQKRKDDRLKSKKVQSEKEDVKKKDSQKETLAEKVLTDEQKKEQDKKEQEKVLTRKDAL